MGSSLKDVLSNIEKKFGKEAIASNKVEIKRVSTGILSLDIALGGGLPKGRLIELMGWESSGKSTLALHIAAEVQKLGKKVAYIDTENGLDLFYANDLGVDTDIEAKNPNFYLMQPSEGEAGLEMMREFAKSDEIGLIVLDSIASLVPKAVIQGEVGDQKMGLIARLMSQWVPTLTSPAKNSGCIILFISQYREKIGVVFGNPITAVGGHAAKFYSSIRMEIARAGQNKDGDEVMSNKTRVKVLKNKVSVPFKKAEFDIEFGTGVDKVKDLINVAVDLEIIKKAGSWFSYGETRLGQGADKVKELLQDNPELVEEITEKIYKKLEK